VSKSAKVVLELYLRRKAAGFETLLALGRGRNRGDDHYCRQAAEVGRYSFDVYAGPMGMVGIAGLAGGRSERCRDSG